MKRPNLSPHLFLTLILVVGMLIGAFNQTLVNALGANTDFPGEKNAVPIPLSFKREDPLASRTNADTLTFRVTFSEAVSGVEPADFMVHDNTPDPTTSAPDIFVSTVTTSVYDVRISGGDLDLFNGVVGLDFSETAEIKDASDNPISIYEPSTDEAYIVDNIVPTVTITPAVGQADPAKKQPVHFNIVFSEEINTGTFETEDILQSGTPHISQWIITDLGDHRNFRLTVVATENGVILPTIAANSVFDLAGSGNQAFRGGCATPEPNNCITLFDDIRPEVTIEQHPNQADPATRLPVRFTVTFSEPINTGDFTTDVIRQIGTARKITWNIFPAGNNRDFILSAAKSTFGTLIPVIPPDQVRDLVGNSNRGSTSTDNSVVFSPIPTPTPVPPTISFTAASFGPFDGWILESSENSGLGGTLDAAGTSFFLGDNAQDKQYRVILHFNTISLPDTAVITKATLKIRKQGVVGSNPFNALGSLRVDMHKPFFGTTLGLAIDDFQATAGKPVVATFWVTPVNNWYVAVVNAAGRAYINRSGYTQFRLYFAADDNNNNIADYMKFFSGDYANASVRPTLFIQYYVP